MFYTSFKLRNPWSERWGDIFNCSALVSTHKAFEFQLMKTTDVIMFEFHATTKQDHAGVYLEIGVAGFSATFHLYDTRHWNHKNSKWEEYYDVT
jgi:hypothetical protein